MTDAVPEQLIGDLFASQGAAEYLGEPVTQAAHMLQTAALARRHHAHDALVAAALLHDVGHLLAGCNDPQVGVSDDQLGSGADNRHSEVGVSWLAQWFGKEVTEPIRLHVAAKRFLCAVESRYADALSLASQHSLGLQGGPMSAAERDEFAAEPYAEAACRLRRWDDQAKDPQASVPAFDEYGRLLARLADPGERQS